jgi:hypothetical protein
LYTWLHGSEEEVKSLKLVQNYSEQSILAAPTIRVPDDLYHALRKIHLELEHEYYSAAPSLQDLVSVSIRRLLSDWENPETREVLLAEALKNREEARSRMGKNFSSR